MSKSAREMRTKAAPPTATENVPSSFFAVFTNLVSKILKKILHQFQSRKNTITTCCESDTASSRPTSRGGTKQTPGAQIRQLS